jgi:single-stranded-DNA-specific exonuclease
MKPVFLTRNLTDHNSRLVGNDKTHLKLGMKEVNSDDSMDGIAFGLGSHFGAISSGEPFDVVYTLEENEWRGNITVQLNVMDIKVGVEEINTKVLTKSRKT